MPEPMTSVTLVRSDESHQPPGCDVDMLRDLFFMHDPTVRAWIARHRESGGTVLAAGDRWVNPGDGTESLTIPLDRRDAEALAVILAAPAPSPVKVADDLFDAAFGWRPGGTSRER